DAAGLESAYSTEIVYHPAASPCQVVLTNLNQVYDGTAKPVSAVTTPNGIQVSLTYNNSPWPPTNAGSYQVIATVTDTNYSGGATNGLIISKGVASIQLGNLAQVYNGSARQASATTTPASLALTLLYNGSGVAPTNVGSYQVSAFINDPNYAGGATNVLTIAKAAASIQLGNLSQSFDGLAKTVSVQTSPTGLAATVLYNNSPLTPTNAGLYQVIATVTDTNYSGAATNTLTISKATASVQLGNLAQVCNGSACQVSATTAPAGLALTILYNGSVVAPTNVGSYQVSAFVTDPNYTGGATNVLTIAKAAASIQLGNLSQSFDGLAKTVSVQTSPAGLAATVVYNNSPLAPTNAGLYQVIATVTDPNYWGSSTDILTVAKAAASVQLNNLNQVYDGYGKTAAVVTLPAGLGAQTLYNGVAASPTNAGQYQVTTTIQDINYLGGATNTLTIAKAAGVLQLAGLTQTYDGTSKPISVTTLPAGLAASVLYGAVSTAPTNAGSYTITVTIADANYSGSATNQLVISPAAGLIQVSLLNQVYDGKPKSITISTVPSGLRVTNAYAGSALPPTNAGTYSVVSRITDSNYVGSAINTLNISQALAKVQLGNLTQTCDGTPKTITVRTTPSGLSVLLTYNGQTLAPTNPGNYTVVATITNQNYFGGTTNTLIMAKGKTQPITSAGTFFPAAPLIKNKTVAPEGTLVLSWSSSTNVVRLWQSTDLVMWSTLTDVSSNSSLTIPSTAGARFFKATAYQTNGWVDVPLLIQGR